MVLTQFWRRPAKSSKVRAVVASLFAIDCTVWLWMILSPPSKTSILNMASTFSIYRAYGRSHTPIPPCILQSPRACLITSTPPRRFASSSAKGEKTKKKRKARTTFRQHDVRDAVQFALCDAMRYWPLHSSLRL